MDSYKAFRKEVLDIETVWQAVEGYERFKKFYIKALYKVRLACWVLHKFRTYKKPTTPILTEVETEAIETIVDPLENGIETINTISTNPRPIYSLKIKCKIQINNWTLDTLGLKDTGCFNTILDLKLVPLKYEKPIPSNSQIHGGTNGRPIIYLYN